MEICEGLQFLIEFLIECLYVLLTVILEQSHGKLVFFLMARAGVSLDGAVELQDDSLESCDLVLVGADPLVGFQVFGLEVLCELLVPVDVHLNNIFA